MIIQVRLFAAAKEIVGQETVHVEVSVGATVADLRHALGENCPAAADILRHSMFSVDSNYAADDFPLSEQAEVACIPPVSGG